MLRHASWLVVVNDLLDTSAASSEMQLRHRSAVLYIR